MKLTSTLWISFMTIGVTLIICHFLVPAISIVASPINPPIWLLYVGIAFLSVSILLAWIDWKIEGSNNAKI